MSRFVVFAIFVFCVAAASPSRAETLAPGQDLSAAPGIVRYILSQSALTDANRVSIAQDRAAGVVCESQYALRVQVLVVTATIEMPPGAARPTAGAWRLGYDVTRCEQVKRFNAQYEVRPEGVARTPLAPGLTIASALLQRDVWTMARINLAASRPGCESPVVLDTRTVTLPEPQRQAWQEEWTILGCGPQLVLQIDYRASPQGGTDIVVNIPSAPR